MKKWLSIFLSLILLCGVLPIGAITANAATSGYYTYTVSNGEATITDFDSSVVGAVNIPSTLGGYPITSIGEYAFFNCSSLTDIAIPDSVTSIGDVAFSYCSSLTSIAIPDSVTSIGDAAFFGCSSLTSITIPNSVTSIGDSAFCGCTSLEKINVNMGNIIYTSIDGVLLDKKVTEIIQYPAGKRTSTYDIPDSVISIGDYAFYNCSSLTKITIPDSVTSIGALAFSDCSSLTSITIPDNITSIGGYAFHGSAWYETITCDAIYIGKVLYEYSGDIVGTFIIKDGTASITDYAFSNCSSLTSITIPDSVTSIGNWTFEDCSLLTDVYYKGTQEQWNGISIGSYNTCLTDANIHFSWNGFDLNGDGTVGAADIVIIKQVLLTSQNTDLIYDVSGDGKTDILDLIRLKKTIAGVR